MQCGYEHNQRSIKLTTRNDITGDQIKTKGILSKQGQDNWERIFGKSRAELVRELEQQEQEKSYQCQSPVDGQSDKRLG